jgi:hypothetical protein
MSTSNRSRARAAQSVLFASLLSLAAAAPALAGTCPADKVGNNPLAGAAKAPVGVTEMELAYIDLSRESVNLPQRRLRYRHMEIQPGGVVPLHSHADRPALIMVNQGHGADRAQGRRDRARIQRSPALVEERRQCRGRADDRRHRQRQEARLDDADDVIACRAGTTAAPDRAG